MKILKVIRFNYKIILSFVAMVSLFSFLFSFSFAKSDDESGKFLQKIIDEFYQLITSLIRKEERLSIEKGA